ncbi:SoxR reducing system RseC family protein [Pseudomonadota bacterium]
MGADMLVETGRVVAVEADALWVETIRRSTCGTCAARQGCGHGLLNRIGDGRSGYVRVLRGPSAERSPCEVNDQVRISIPEQVILRGSVVVYMLPLLCMLAGAALAVRLFPAGSEILAAAGAAVGLGLGFGLVRWHAWRHRHDRELQPTVLEVLPQPAMTLESS